MRIRVIWEGKTKDVHLRALAADYQKRIARFVDIQIEETRPLRGGALHAPEALSANEKRLLEKLRGSTKVFLDGRGREKSSQEIAEWLGAQAMRGARDVAFVVGGADGFSPAFRQEADLLVSLSRMTLTHEWARALLLEQIYRGFTILRGYPYPR
jgi:23S rRNA (pseudouridine1915-N3)-methyltransferase